MLVNKSTPSPPFTQTSLPLHPSHILSPLPALILALPLGRNPAQILCRTSQTLVPDPQSHDRDRAPEQQSYPKSDPEDDAAVHDIQDLEADEEDEED